MKMIQKHRQQTMAAATTKWIPLLLVTTWLLWPARAWAGCDKDTDCKGDRICVSGQCQAPDPSTFSPRQQRSPDTSAIKGTTSANREFEAIKKRVHAQSWPFNFSTRQINDLLTIGCRFDITDFTNAKRMKSRGFTEDQYVFAYRDLYSQGIAQRHRAVEMAVFRQAGLPTSEFGQYLAHGGSMTDYYNSRIGGGGAVAAGVSLLILGIGGVVAGAVLYDEGVSQENKHEACIPSQYVCDTVGKYRKDYKLSGALSMAGGFILGAVGLPLTIVGGIKRGRWAEAGALDDSSAEDLYQYRKYASGTERSSRYAQSKAKGNNTSRTDPTYRVYPITHAKGGGIGFTMWF